MLKTAPTAQLADAIRRVAGGGMTTLTVEAYMSRLFERMDVTSRTELATKVLREAWLELPRG